MNRSDDLFDAIIVGGGVAGCAATLNLYANGWKVALLHSGHSFSGMESISPTASRHLSRYSLQPGIQFSQIVSWWGSQNPSLVPCLGARIVPREALVQEMQALIKLKPILVEQAKRLTHLVHIGDIWHMAFDDSGKGNGTLRSRYVIDASGRASAVGKMLGSKREISDRLCCVSIKVASPRGVGVWTEAVQNGWWNFCSDGTNGTLSFYTTPTFLKSAWHDFPACLLQTSEMRRLAALSKPEIQKVRLCGSSLLSPSAGQGWLAIGDAAMTFQPLASAGVSAALQDANEVVLFFAWKPEECHHFRRLHYSRYLQALEDQYRIEKRWQNAEFWRAAFQSTPKISRKTTVSNVMSSFT